MKRIILYLLFCLVTTPPIYSQIIPGIPSNQINKNNAQDKSRVEAREKLLAQRKIVLEQILADIGKVEEAEIRASYLSAAGKEFCKDGNKQRAVEIFDKSIKEFYTAKAKAEIINDKKSIEIIYGGSPRIQIIQDVNECDSELAYDYMLKTRPAKLSETLNKFYQNLNYSTLEPRISGIVSWEVIRESNLKRETLYKKPERAEEFVKKDLNTLITNQTFYILRDLSGLNSSLANNLAENVVEKLLRSKLNNLIEGHPNTMVYPNNFQVASTFLQELGNKNESDFNKLKISDDNLFRLADKIAQEAIEAKYDWIFTEALKVIQRISPDRYNEYLEMKAEKLKSPEGIEAKKYNDLMKASVPVEKLLSEAENFSEERQLKIYKIAACRLASEGNLMSAEDVLSENFPDTGNTDKRLSAILYSFALTSSKSGKDDFQQFEKQIGQMTDPELKIEALTLRAFTIYNADKDKNKEKALFLLTQAVKEFNSNSEAIKKAEAYGDIISAYSTIDPDIAFTMFESVLDDETKFKTEDYFKYNKIEDLSWIGLFGGIRNMDHRTAVSNLANINFERTLNIINNQKSIYSRIRDKLKILEREFSSIHGLRELKRFCE